jgi:hypothetical protein
LQPTRAAELIADFSDAADEWFLLIDPPAIGTQATTTTPHPDTTPMRVSLW